MSDPALKLYYPCPKCHRPIFMPSFLRTARINGRVNIKCGNRQCQGGTVSLTFRLPFDPTAAFVEHVLEAANG